MIDTKSVWDRLNVLSTNGTSGNYSADTFNSDLHSVQYEALGILLPFYEKNQLIADILSPFIISIDKVSDTGGIVAKESNYYGLATIWMTKNGMNYPSYKLALSEVSNTKISPIRMPVYANNETAYYLSDNSIKMLPEQVMSVKVFYIKNPTEASITTTIVSTANSDYVIVSSQVNLDWNMNAFNLIVYMMLEKMGVAQKEELFMQFSQLGIQRDMINTNPQ